MPFQPTPLVCFMYPTMLTLLIVCTGAGHVVQIIACVSKLQDKLVDGLT